MSSHTDTPATGPEVGPVTNILVCGIGGQGVMTAAELLAQAAISLGHDVKKTEVAGMAQRGGVVTSHVRFGPKVVAPAIAPGEADLLIGFEVAEALRWTTHLKPDGCAMVNVMRIPPLVVSGGLFPYPDDPVAQMQASGRQVIAFDAEAIARQLGTVRLVNTILLGAIADHLPFPAEVLRDTVLAGFRARKPALVELNAQAFDTGRATAREREMAKAV
ncbi:indolepyruvate oxidoreductase subunit beta [Roseospirillum parvum]|uniref:Indolepyruvate ferredoxin oxidoreductase beta subunit n=1 Tax=Roseospirillum parvum TaxID=83401 RepID=A0A1G7ZXI0_9PROT|nr:indolepyruvate oxidoreductase subunit beta [Roseospirillum parvum]SDH13362.1 indolepyruvate ferredoxin oxidoreductase beta subunit [Roseospirillum parvum]